MKYRRFEELPVWQDGIRLTTLAFMLTQNKAFRYQGDLANQLQRAALSVPNNIAEGYERGSTRELIQFLYIARGSSGEVRSICHVMSELPFLNSMIQQIEEIRKLSEGICRQLRLWARGAQDSEISGQRDLSKTTVLQTRREKQRRAFLERIKAMTEGADVSALISDETDTL